MKINGVYMGGCSCFGEGFAIVEERGTELQTPELLAAQKYPIKETDCWQRKKRQEYLRKLYKERLKNES